ncbi:MAG: hypothetical protein A2Z04_09855 [Chloroflexi bacterium RBG_16_57_9]|nr:MAG: hypothetical protein A2Z04_09855 [Chloroflexi bacterium RBG_16_57_9]
MMEQLLNVAQRLQNSLLVAMTHWLLGWLMFHAGEFASSQEYLQQALAVYDPEQYPNLAFVYEQDPGVSILVWKASNLWCLGYPDQSLHWSQEALALARKLRHPFTTAFALTQLGRLHVFRRESQSSRELFEALMRLADEEELGWHTAALSLVKGFWMVDAGQVEEGFALASQGRANMASRGFELLRPYHLARTAERHGNVGQAEQGLKLLDEALACLERTGERSYEAEIYWLKGELLQKAEGGRQQAEAEACFRRAIGVARRQQAKSWELRVVVSLSRLWQRQGKREEARKILADIYGWFTEGFDTPDLREGRALLEELT